MDSGNPGSPSGSLMAQQSKLLSAYAPFSLMPPGDVQALLLGAREVYFAPQEVIFKPGQAAPDHVYIVKQGQVTADAGQAGHASAFYYDAGQMFPVGAALAASAVHSRHTAVVDTFCWKVPAARLQEVAARSVPLAEALTQESRMLLQLSRKALQTALSSEVFSHFSMERPLSALGSKQPLSCLPGTLLGEALRSMQSRRVGSIVVCDEAGRCQGIFTLKDVIGKVVLPQVALDAPISSVMTSPVHTLLATDTVEDAALLMARHGVRHVPVVDSREDGRLLNIVSERDLYALQRLTLNQVSTAARNAADVEQMRKVAQDIRLLARNLVSQGVQAKSLTHLISHLNDVLTERLVALMLQRHGLPLDGLCWLSFGSEGRSEQTIATDQDNGLIFVPPDDASGLEAQRQRWMAFARDVNEALDACGYPLCKGNIMASNPECCLTLQEWQSRFDRWIHHGSPEDLLRANIYFDLRALAGNTGLGAALRAHVGANANTVPRFLHLMAQDMLQRSVPLSWLGHIETSTQEGREVIDLKLQGTAIYVDAARLRSLSLGVSACNTRERFEACARVAGKDPKTAQGRAEAFEYLQMLRLRVQMAQVDASGSGAVQVASQAVAGLVPGQPNAIAVNELSDIDRKLLKESLRVARELQQEMRMDFGA